MSVNLIADYCHRFELAVAKYYKLGYVQSPIYLSIGTEHIAATLYHYASQPFDLFAQHRCHSYFLSSTIHDSDGYDSHKKLARELCGLPTGCNKGMGGSASISHPSMFGHSGLLGDQVPIAVGYAHASKKPTVCVLGDAAAEEDYVLGAIGFAATHHAPVLFLCEDNNLSILTEVKTRRSWSITNVANAMGIRSVSLTDQQFVSGTYINQFFNYPKPLFLNVHCKRGCWHAGVGDQDLTNSFLENYPISEDSQNSNQFIIDSMWGAVIKEVDDYRQRSN